MFKIIVLFFFLCTSAHSNEYLLGSGFSKVTQGRTSPNLYLGYDMENSLAQLTSVGVRTEVYFQSTYQLSYFLQKNWNTIFRLPYKVGVGLGGLYSVRAFKDDFNNTEEKAEDFVIGPTFRLGVDIGDSFFVSLDALYGIKSLVSLVLSFQNTNSINIGVRF